MSGRIEQGFPKGMKLVRLPDGIAVVRKWFNAGTVPLTVFALVWNGFLAYWYLGAADSEDLLAILFPLVHVGAGLIVGYRAVAGWVNRTEIVAKTAELQVRHRPLPWVGNRTIGLLDIDQIYTKERAPTGDGRRSASYTVLLKTRTGKNIKLVSRLSSKEQALFIEQELERRVGVEDRPV